MSKQPILPKHAQYFAKIVAISPNELWRSEGVRHAAELARNDAEYVRLATQDESAATARLVEICRENLLLRLADFIEAFEFDAKGGAFSKAPTRAEFIALIKGAKQANEARLEPLRAWRRIADKLLADPLCTPEVAAMIEQQQQQINEMMEANKAVERQIANLFFEHDVEALFADEGSGT